MPDARLVRTRRTLPEGYQFGDANVARHYQRLYDAFDSDAERHPVIEGAR